MLRINPSYNAAGTIRYFKEALQKGDYYTENQNSVGSWNGKLAGRLGLEGEVRQEDFIALCYNLHPQDQSRLNPRNKENRKVGYDLTFSSNKSASLLYAISGDEKIKQAFEASVEETMRELEQDIRFQEGQGKQKQLTKSGEMIWGSFTHLTTRPVDGIPDPHLHRHCFVMNTTWNETLNRYQAAEFSTIKRDAPYWEAVADSKFVMKMVELGYPVERRGLSWEVVGIEEATLKKFSRRTAEIEQAAKKVRAEKGALSAKQKAQLGVMIRAKKVVTQSWEQLKTIWRSWLTKKEVRQIEEAKEKCLKSTPAFSAVNVVERAEAHLFQRRSVIKEIQLKTEMLKRSFGQLTPEQVNETVAHGGYLTKTMKGQTYLTTQQMVEEEKQMLAMVRLGKGTVRPINSTYTVTDPILTSEQCQAVRYALADRNQVTLISGKAGVGKTTLMKQVRQGVEAAGKEFHAFAPTVAAARDVMVKEGFENANTVASLLINPDQQQRIKNGYVWIDEGGLLGLKEMNALLKIAHKQNARLLITGDSRQHHSVSRGDAFRILEKEAGLKVAQVSQIQRQRNHPRFKEVVALAAKGKTDQALHQLDLQGAVVEEAKGAARLAQLVEDYTRSVKLEESSLLISPTHLEGQNVTAALRDKLKEMQLVKTEERSFIQYKTAYHTEEQKRDPFHYQSDEPLMVEYHQNCKGFVKGQRWEVEQGKDERIRLKRGLTRKDLPLEYANRFTLYRQQELKLAIGDKIRITKNTKTKEGTRIHNGSVYQITGFTKQGDIKLHTGKTLDKAFGHLDYGYVRTSHSSQGTTVDKVFIAQASDSFAATTQQQFYVSLSRARKGARIYTDDKRELERAVMRDGKRLTAREIAAQKDSHQRRMSARISSTIYQNPSQPQDHGYTR